mmetsp:Transcript_16604/g.42806  ORF Transcript_16604/g.42806 Transcript_16604/m.42806 type:complete len:116 (+) Transcript_16604:1807-2154(+)
MRKIFPAGSVLIISVDDAKVRSRHSTSQPFSNSDSSTHFPPSNFQQGRVAVVAGVSDEHVEKGLKADAWAREAVKSIGGKGGGKPVAAQAQGAGSRDSVEQVHSDAAGFASGILG